jgi:hypothetical protein
MRVFNQPKIGLQGLTMNTTLNSSAISLKGIYGYAVQVVWTGTPNGSLKLQASSDAAGDQASPLNLTNTVTNWSDVANSSTAITAAGNYMWNVSEVMYNWVRVVYTDSSGGSSTAVITVSQINAKGV